MDSKLERLRERLLTCAVCMDEYKDPRILPCYHSLCFDCIASVIQSSSVTGRYFRCPQCRSDVIIPSGGIQELPINFYIMSVQDELSSREYDGECELCKGIDIPSEFRCVDCDKDICRFCIHSHLLEFHCDKPKILRIQRNSASSHPASSNLLCSVHSNEKLQLYCYTCDAPVCVSCSCGSHKKHHLTPMSDKLGELRSILKNEMVKIDTDVKNLIDANQLMEEIKKDVLAISEKSLLELDKAASAACESILRKKSTIRREISNSEEHQVKEIEVVQTKLRTLLKSMHKGYHYLGDLQEPDMCLEAFQCFKHFTKKLDEARKEFSSIKLIVQEKKFFSSDISYTPEFPLRFLRLKEMIYYGKLGRLKSSFLHVDINNKTLLTKRKETLSFMKMCSSYRTHVRQLFIFCIVLLFSSLAFWFFDDIKLSSMPMVYSNLTETLEVANATLHNSINAAKQYLHDVYLHLFLKYNEESIPNQDA